MGFSLPEGWKSVPLGEVAQVVPGYAFKSEDWCTGGIPVIKIKNIRGDLTVDTSEADCVPPEMLTSRLSKFELKNGDFLVAMTGATAGKVGRLRSQTKMLLNQRVAKITPRSIDADYLWSVLSSKEYQERFYKLADGAAQPNMSGSQIEGVLIPVPSSTQQGWIGQCVGAYDDLIENNTRRIKILEEMVRIIYREWFVNFRFPGHENVKMVESELGPIPEGWRVRNLFDVAHVTYGFPFKSKLFTAGGKGVPVIRIRDIKSDLSNTFTTEAPDTKYVVKNGDLLVGMDGDFHMGKWAGGNAYLNQRVVRFRPQGEVPPYFLFLALEAPINHFDSTIVGTTVAHLSDRDLRSTSLLIPSDDILKRTSAIFNPGFGLEIALKLRTANLRTTRDLLLPRLISGEVSVETAEDAMLEAVG